MSAISKNESRYLDFLENLPLFKGLKKEEINQIASNIVLKIYRKGEILPLASESQSRLYILYKGQSKLVKINDRGEELILRFIKQRDVLSSMHFSSLFDTCLEFIEDASLLSLSEEAVNKYIAINHSFASNIITMLSDNIQLLMTNAEIWRLKTAKEKVGWYLNSININNLGRLTVSKSAIASFLGITPESFSRALKKLGKEGIKIENKQVRQSKNSGLCFYCDKIVGAKCDLYGSGKCQIAFQKPKL
tara:strand:+ start:1455 stop:2198 length:744 start_codon:yes stop_codon:yes gene_type:complete